MVILVVNVLRQNFLLLYVCVFCFFLIKADKCDMGWIPVSAVVLINLSLKMHRHCHQDPVKGAEKN